MTVIKEERATVEIGIVGAGISGLGTAYHLLKTAKRLGRDVAVTVYDKNSSAGGTWSRDSVYPGLMTNNSWKQMLFDDDEETGEKIFSSDPSAGAGPGGFRASGTGMVQVMDQVERQVKALGASIMYATQVNKVYRGESGWVVEASPIEEPEATIVKRFDKVVVATGAFSRPAVPSCAASLLQPFRQPVASDKLTAPLAIHTSHLSDPTVQEALNAMHRTIVVVGASKSALDAAERFSTLGHDVTLVLRNPPYLAPPAIPTPNGPADAVAMVGTRQKAIGVPYPADPVSRTWGSGGFWSIFYRRLVHSSWLSAFFHPSIIAKSVAGFAGWGQWAHPMMSLMKPKIDLMWSESAIFPGPETFAQLVQSGKIKLVGGALVGMKRDESGFILDVQNNGMATTLAATGVIFGSGWSTGEYPFFSPSDLEALGLPCSSTDVPKREKEFADADKSSLKRVLGSLRTMRFMPAQWTLPGFSARFGATGAPKIAPYRLYRLMVPLDSLYDRDIAFAGIPTCKANHVLFICQAHWIADYFFDLLPRLPSRKQAMTEISTQTVWAQRLFGPSHGRLGQWLGAMWIEYCSRLCWDMGVEDDGQGWDGVVVSSTYALEKKRALRDCQ